MISRCCVVVALSASCAIGQTFDPVYWDLRVDILSGTRPSGVTRPVDYGSAFGLENYLPSMTPQGVAVLPTSTGMYVRDPNGSVRLVREAGTPLISQAGFATTYSAFGKSLMDEQGRIFSWDDSSGSVRFVSAGDGSGRQVLANGMFLTDDLTSPRLGRIFQPLVAGNGRLHFLAEPVGSGRSLWRWTPTQGPMQILGPNEQAPGLPAGVRIASSVEYLGQPLNARGQSLAVFFLDRSSPGVTTENDSMFYLGENDTLVPLARRGDTLPGGARLNWIGPSGINSAGDIVAFVSTGTGQSWSIARVRNQQINLLPTPITGTASTALVNARGNFACLTSTQVIFGNDSGVQFTASHRTPLLQLPGVTIGGDISSLVFNAQDDLVFRSTLVNAQGVAFTSAILHWSPDRQLEVLLAIGQLFPVGLGDSRTIQRFAYSHGSGGEDGRASALSDRRTMTFLLWFTDGSSGAFTVAIPAPGTLPALLAGGMLLARRRCRPHAG